MLVLCLAIAIAAAGALLSKTGGSSPGDCARLSFHVATIAGVGTALAFVGQLLPRFSPCVIGAWFVVLAIIYGGHAIAVRSWGSPMNRDVLLFAVRKLPYFARVHRNASLAAVAMLAIVFTCGWATARFDVPIGTAGRMEFYFVSTCVLIGGAAVVWRAARLTARTDLVMGFFLDGHGPMPGPPPNDPSLGPRTVHRTNAPRRRANVFLFVVDSMRARNLSPYGYHRATTPFLDSLLARGARAVPMALANSPSTESALWALFSSRRPRHQAVNAPCLHDLLRTAGYGVRFVLSGSHRHWMGLDALYGSDHDGLIDQLIDEQVVAETQKFRPASARGNFMFFHLMSTHGASGREPDEVWTPSRNRFAYSESDDFDDATRAQMLNHYDNSILQADTYLARICEVLAAKGLLDDAIVIVTGDHGEALAERVPVMIGHARGLYQESIHVPLIVWDSTRALPAPPFLADHTDVAPTILAMLEMEAPFAWQGASLWASARRHYAHVEYIAHRTGAPPTHMQAMVASMPEGLYKLMRYHQSSREIVRRAFCLSTDPDEHRDLSASIGNELGTRLGNILREYDDGPALAFSTTWKFLERAKDGAPASASASRDAFAPAPEVV